MIRFTLTAMLVLLGTGCSPASEEHTDRKQHREATGSHPDRKHDPQAPTGTSLPNLIVILIDDARWDEFGSTGHPFVRTPHMDRLSREGARFTNAFTPAPLCSPSRASILTGLYPHRHGIVDNTDRSPASHALDTFPKRLKAAGYQSAFIGKWHMGNDETARPGFDYWVSMKGQGEAIDPELHENGFTRRIGGYTPTARSA
jgi:N-acetylglucosamine-6-sulfatase